MSSSKRGTGAYVCRLCGYGATTPGGLTKHEGGKHCTKRASRKRPRATASGNDDGEQDAPEEESLDRKRARVNEQSEDDHSDYDRLQASLSALREAVIYEKTHARLTATIAANTAERERREAQLKKERLERDHADVAVRKFENARVTIAETITAARADLDAAQRQLAQARASRDQLTHFQENYTDLLGPAKHMMDEHYAALSANFADGIKIAFTLDPYYVDEKGRVAASRLETVLARAVPTMQGDIARADKAIREAHEGVDKATAKVSSAVGDESRLLRELSTAQETSALHQNTVANTENALAALVAEWNRVAAAAHEEFDRAYDGLSKTARHFVKQRRNEAALGQAVNGTIMEITGYLDTP